MNDSGSTSKMSRKYNDQPSRKEEQKSKREIETYYCLVFI